MLYKLIQKLFKIQINNNNYHNKNNRVLKSMSVLIQTSQIAVQHNNQIQQIIHKRKDVLPVIQAII
jgi:hypothetical protein